MEIIPSEFTDDEFEQLLLTADNQATIEPDDKMAVQVSQIGTELANLRVKLPQAQRRCPPYLYSGLNNVKVAELAGCSPGTVAKARKNPDVRRILALLERLNRLHTGPQEAQRMAMLWRIAKREEEKQPRVAINALDVINKQAGIYQRDDGTSDGPVVVKINRFVVNAPEQAQQAPNQRQRAEKAVEIVEAEFKTVSVETNPE